MNLFYFEIAYMGNEKQGLNWSPSPNPFVLTLDRLQWEAFSRYHSLVHVDNFLVAHHKLALVVVGSNFKGNQSIATVKPKIRLQNRGTLARLSQHLHQPRFNEWSLYTWNCITHQLWIQVHWILWYSWCFWITNKNCFSKLNVRYLEL